MIILKRISNYWLCQIAGWGFVMLLYIFLSYTFGNLSDSILIRIGLFILVSFLVTHFLRWVIKQLNWQLLPIEKGLPRFILATIIACVFAGLIVIGFVTYFEYTGVFDSSSSKNLNFFTRLLTTTADLGLFISPWVLIYYFYHYIAKTRRQHQ